MTGIKTSIEAYIGPEPPMAIGLSDDVNINMARLEQLGELDYRVDVIAQTIVSWILWTGCWRDAAVDVWRNLDTGEIFYDIAELRARSRREVPRTELVPGWKQFSSERSFCEWVATKFPSAAPSTFMIRHELIKKMLALWAKSNSISQMHEAVFYQTVQRVMSPGRQSYMAITDAFDFEEQRDGIRVAGVKPEYSTILTGESNPDLMDAVIAAKDKIEIVEDRVNRGDGVRAIKRDVTAELGLGQVYQRFDTDTLKRTIYYTTPQIDAGGNVRVSETHVYELVYRDKDGNIFELQDMPD